MNDESLTHNGVSAALAAGTALAEPKVMVPGEFALAVVPSGYIVKDIDLEKHLPRPNRKRGTASLDDVPSFILAVNREKSATTQLYAKQGSLSANPTFTAVFNGNEFCASEGASETTASAAGWGDHRAVYACPLSDEWKTWMASDGKAKGQSDFAQFIEDNLPDLVAPDGSDLPQAATMLEVSRTLEAKSNVNFASAIRLSDGSQQFTYSEDVQGTSQNGQMKVPERFAIGIPVFINGEKWRVDARLRYRITGGKLAMWYDLDRPHKVLDEAFKGVRSAVESGTSLTALLGSPRS